MESRTFGNASSFNQKDRQLHYDLVEHMDLQRWPDEWDVQQPQNPLEVLVSFFHSLRSPILAVGRQLHIELERQFSETVKRIVKAYAEIPEPIKDLAVEQQRKDSRKGKPSSPPRHVGPLPRGGPFAKGGMKYHR